MVQVRLSAKLILVYLRYIFFPLSLMCFFFESYFFPLACFPLSYCNPSTAFSRGFGDKRIASVNYNTF